MGWLGNILKVAAPVAGFALGGPLGGMIGGAVSSGISGAEKGSQANKLRQQQLAQAQQRFAAGAPFRAKLAELAKRPTAQRQDLSSMIADPGNPYARAKPTLASIAQPQPMQPQPMQPPVATGGSFMKRGLQNLRGAMNHPEPDIDQMGGPSDMDQDNPMGGGLLSQIARRRQPMGMGGFR